MKKKYFSKTDFLLLATWGVYFAVLIPRMIWFTPGANGGLYVGHEYLWSDWASLHTNMTQIFWHKAPHDWFAYHPIYAEGRFTYPFLINWISGMLARAGLPFPMAMWLPCLLSFLALLLGLRRLFTWILGSQTLAFGAITLFFCSAGLAFSSELAALWSTQSWSRAFPISTLLSAVPSHQWGANNFLIAMLLPQRAFTLGLPLCVWALYGLLTRSELAALTRRDRAVLILCGFTVGMMPIVHAHSLIAMAIVCAPWGLWLLARKKPAAFYFGAATVASTALFYGLFTAGGIQTKNFMHFFPGYTATSVWDWLKFWVWVWGLALPLALFTFVATLRKKQLTPIFWCTLGGLLIFAAANLVLFQPTAWDNAKLFLWAYLLLCPAIILTLQKIRRWGKYAAVAAFALCTLTGALELSDLQLVGRHTFRLLSNNELLLADKIREQTGPLDRFACATAHDHYVSTWAARPVLVGYLGWVSNYGFNYEQTYEDLKTIYQGGPQTEALLKKHDVKYVVIGPQERAEFKNINEDYFKTHYPMAFHDPALGVVIYKI